ncbi:MAG TPA: hypothetical protein VFB79_00445 [Candidatus Angelobacter sp.]|nr:hypothetical protein [Candidatus Angelobacter sp.]
MGDTAIAVLPFSADGFMSALRSAAVPGYTGSIYVEFAIKPEAAQKVELNITRRTMYKANGKQEQQTIPATGDPAREEPIQNCVGDLRSKLCIRPTILAVEVHYNDGVLSKYQVVE